MYAKRIERRLREIIEPELGNTQCGFPLSRSTTNFPSSEIFPVIYGVCQRFLPMFCRPWESISGKVLQSIVGVRCWRSPITGRYIIAFLLRGFMSGSSGVKSQPFTLWTVGLRQGCILSPLLFIVDVNWIDKHSRIDGGVTVGSCRVNGLLFAQTIWYCLLHRLNSFQHSPDWFAAPCDQTGMKISRKRPRNHVFPENQASARCK